MEKLIYLLGDAEKGVLPEARRDLRTALIGAGGDFERAGARQLSFCVADLDEPVPDEVAQFNAHGLIDAKLSLWLDSLDERAAIEEILAPLSARYAGYLVTESVPRDYAKRDWPDGERSPGVALVTTFGKLEGIDDETFYARWHGSHTPISLELHPLLHYVRNAVVRVLTPGAPALRSIVNESVASVAVAADEKQFYGSSENRKRAVNDLLSFVDFETLSTTLMSEYILSS